MAALLTQITNFENQKRISTKDIFEAKIQHFYSSQKLDLSQNT